MTFLIAKLGKYILITAVMLTLVDQMPGGKAIESLIMTTKTEIEKIDFKVLASDSYHNLKTVITDAINVEDKGNDAFE